MEKIDFEKATIEEIVEFVNVEFANKEKKSTLETVAELLATKKSRLASKLSKNGYVCKNRQYIKAPATTEPQLDAKDLMYLLNSSFTKQMSARVEETTYNNFLKICEAKFANIPTAKLISLALKEFTEKHQ